MIRLKDNGKFSKPMISRKTMTKFVYGKTVFSNTKNDFKKDLPALPPREFFPVKIIDK